MQDPNLARARGNTTFSPEMDRDSSTGRYILYIPVSSPLFPLSLFLFIRTFVLVCPLSLIKRWEKERGKQYYVYSIYLPVYTICALFGLAAAIKLAI